MRRRVPTEHVEEDTVLADTKRGRALKDEIPWSESKLLLSCTAFRLLNAIVLQTFFNPDEYWQSVEVAHRIVFGYGHLTWEWSEGLRSYIHPLIFAGLYKVLKCTKMDTRWLVMKAPRLLQALFAAAGDLYLFRLTKLHWGDYAAQWAIFCQLCNWFTFFCMVRTFSNCLETVLTLAALYYWVVGERLPKFKCFSSFTARQVALFLAALACVIRPTGALVWVYVGLIGLVKTDKKSQLLFEVIFIGVMTFGASCLVDRWMYGKWIFVPLNFLRFNFLASGGNYYVATCRFIRMGFEFIQLFGAQRVQPRRPNVQQPLHAENGAENQPIGAENQPQEVAIDAPQVGEQLWKHYLLGADFTVQTDYQSLRYFFTQAKLSEKHLSRAIFLSLFHFQLVHVASKKNVVVDALSRRRHVAAMSIAYQHELDEMRDHYSTDEEFTKPYDALVCGEHLDSYLLKDGFLMFREKLCVSGLLRQKVMIQSFTTLCGSQRDWFDDQSFRDVFLLAFIAKGYSELCLQLFDLFAKGCYALASMQNYVGEQCLDSGSILSDGSNVKTDRNMFRFRKQNWRRACVVGLLITNIPIALYTSVVHQRGTEAVMHFLSEEIARGRATNVAFLMPCHSTPYYSFLHANVTLRFLDCTPSDESGYIDESDRFLANPATFLHTFLRSEERLPSHFVFYDSMEEHLLPFLKEYGYHQVRRIFHAHLPVDHGPINHVIVYNARD
ncbi:hypothetical protein L7F22_045529 [Adiantum nelumboides]|nr:hypothetical protein [Adiantum nelumboides]